MKYTAVHTLTIALLSILTLVHASAVRAGTDPAPELHTYYISEPVFDGQAYVTEAGREHAKTILLVHGLGPNGARIWLPLIPALAKRYHVIAVDLPGFGHSSKGNALYSPARYTQFLDYLVERTANAPYLLVGHSMGANVAINYTIAHPQRFERLVLADVAGILHRFAYSEYLTHFGIEHIPEFYPNQNDELRDFTARMLESLSLNADWMNRAERLILENPDWRQTVLRGEPNTIAGYAMAMADYSGELEKLTQPTLLLWGAQDSVTPLRTARVLARRLPRAALVTLPDAGHSPMSDQPRAFQDWLQRFADTQDEQLASLLQTHAYALPAPVSGELKDYRCDKQPGQTIKGAFATVRIEGCRDMTLKNVYARQVVITDSVVSIENCRLEGAQGAMHIERARVTMTACHIQGRPALTLGDAEVDIAGSELVGRSYAVRNRQSGPGSQLLFSVSKVVSQFIDKPVHGPTRLAPGEGM